MILDATARAFIAVTDIDENTRCAAKAPTPDRYHYYDASPASSPDDEQPCG